MGILIVARADIGQNILVVVLFAFHQQLFIAALCAGFRGGSQEDFYRCVGQHHSADIAAIHQHIAAGGQSALGIQQKGAHSRNRRHSGSRHADLLGTDSRGDILAVQVKVLGALLQLGIQVDLRQQGLHGSGIMRVLALAHGVQADGAVHGTGIYIGKAHIRSKAFGKAGFARPGRAIDCNRDHQKNFLPL